MNIAGASKLYEFVMLSMKDEEFSCILYLEYQDGEFVPTEIKDADHEEKRPVTEEDGPIIRKILSHDTAQSFIRHGKGEYEQR